MYPAKRWLRSLTGDLRKYLIVGFLNTFVGLLIIFFCLYFLKFNDIQSNLVGYGVGFTVSFFLNKNWTFQHHGKLARPALLFGIVVFFSYIANLAIVVFFSRHLETSIYGAQIVGLFTYTVVSFLGARYLAFPARKKHAFE